jgi:hypothetical protein
MCASVNLFNDPPYYYNPIKNQIGYKDHDTISYEKTYGYRTVFAYLNESKKGKIRDQNILNEVIKLRVPCGQFSYCAINPKRILGVSGTMKVLGNDGKQIMSKFGIKNYSFMPSVYGKSNFQFDHAGRGIYIENSLSDYFQRITTDINSLTHTLKGDEQPRSVIVFFETNEKLEQYRASTYFKMIVKKPNFLLENIDKEDKTYIIEKAATISQVTISTAIFGRGTDFSCHDSRLEKSGGMHVIQTFLSEERSEELQIQGRTARQGNVGSYELILLSTDLEKFNISKQKLSSTAFNQRYELLNNARIRYHEEEFKKLGENLVEATKRDKTSHDYFDSLLNSNGPLSSKLFKELYQINMNPNKFKFSRTICLSDATGSMSSLWNATKCYIEEMLRRIDEIGNSNSELMWIAYRDYC